MDGTLANKSTRCQRVYALRTEENSNQINWYMFTLHHVLIFGITTSLDCTQYCIVVFWHSKKLKFQCMIEVLVDSTQEIPFEPILSFYSARRGFSGSFHIKCLIVIQFYNSENSIMNWWLCGAKETGINLWVLVRMNVCQNWTQFQDIVQKL